MAHFCFQSQLFQSSRSYKTAYYFPTASGITRSKRITRFHQQKRSTKRGFINVKLHISVSCSLLDVIKKFKLNRSARKSVKFMKGFVKIVSFSFVTLSYGCCFHLQKIYISMALNNNKKSFQISIAIISYTQADGGKVLNLNN